ncbi:hypothetical protein MAC_03414 [Metarhizium acridum CQMa 102]|uniref:Uncharacterized protein n=1 Tax=Metarhizium acridum (strain CQMa 102) TaxID=655827 RepID=E9E0L6_METAQ|nr:uncharacterized protein MAC_03414 [Metarhizium acridum CQMa 102]EFY90636.1 hypothetical protein MAC_03414 [Metarhizium acridum CQMa 102]
MVRIYNLALIALSASALAATTYNERRAVDDVGEFDLAGRSAPLMDFDKREDSKIAEARKEMKAANQAANAAIPEDAKNKVQEARKNLKDANDAARAAIPEDAKNKVEEAKKNLKDASDAAKAAIPEDAKKKVDEARKSMQDAKDAADAAIPEDLRKQRDEKKKAFQDAKNQNASQTAPAQAAPTASAAPAEPPKF